jgi:hypothetical protein
MGFTGLLRDRRGSLLAGCVRSWRRCPGQPADGHFHPDTDGHFHPDTDGHFHPDTDGHFHPDTDPFAGTRFAGYPDTCLVHDGPGAVRHDRLGRICLGDQLRLALRRAD